jgi:hypothetical protein
LSAELNRNLAIRQTLAQVKTYCDLKHILAGDKAYLGRLAKPYG